jgi:ComF family protein
VSRRNLPALQALLDLVFPGRCLACGAWLSPGRADGVPVCEACSQGLVRLSAPLCRKCGIRLISEKETCLRCREAQFVFESNTALFAYGGAVRELIHCLKFEGRRRLAVLFADAAAQALRCLPSGLPIVPVPPRKGRKSPDAVERVARAIRSRHGAEVIRLLERSGSLQQKALGLAERRENIRGTIRLSPAAAGVKLPLRVVLLDDVFTTGATLDACARTLLNAGCQTVQAMTLAIEE